MIELTAADKEEVTGGFVHGALAGGAKMIGTVGNSVLTLNGLALGGATQQIIDSNAK